MAEEHVLAAHSGALVVRPGPLFGPWDERDRLRVALSRLAAGRPFAAPDAEVVSPTYVPDLVNATLDLLLDGERGIWHVANQGEMTWFELVECAAGAAGVDTACLEPAGSSLPGTGGERPRYTALGSERGTLLPSVEAALTRFVEGLRASGVTWAEMGEAAGASEIPPLRALPGVA
jgi:dTDP-4-dehydrorhamnose reductase